MECKDCDYFSANGKYDQHNGVCNLELPLWVARMANVSWFAIDKGVCVEDGCSLGRKKENSPEVK